MAKTTHGRNCNCADCKKKYGGSREGMKKDGGSFVPPLPFQSKKQKK